MMRLRKIWAEGSFSVLKREHCISKIRKRGISAAAEECLLAVMALNLKRMVRAIFNKLKIRFMWAEEVFPQPSFSFCQQVQSLTLPPAALRANILAQVSFALNRVYTEFYPSRRYPNRIDRILEPFKIDYFLYKPP